MNTIRAFFAIIPSKSLSEILADVLETLKGAFPKHSIKWINVENLHVTLHFLKSIQPEHLNSLIEEVRTGLKETPKFQLEFNHLEWFPGPRNPKILTLAVGPQDTLKTLVTLIGHSISAINYPVDSRPFRGHMTIGRVPHSRVQPSLLVQITLPSIPAMEIDELYLIESRPDKGRTSYCPLAQFKLRS